MPLDAAIVTASDKGSKGLREDKSGAKVQEMIAEAGPEALLELREDHGGNTVIRRHEADLLLLDVPAEELRDVDTAQALEELIAEEQV